MKDSDRTAGQPEVAIRYEADAVLAERQADLILHNLLTGRTQKE